MTGAEPQTTPPVAQTQVRPSSLVDALYSDNGKWGLIYVAIASAAATFVLAGRLGWEIGAGVIVILIITALCVTALREMQARKAAERRVEERQLRPVANEMSATESATASTQEPGSSYETSSTPPGPDSKLTKGADAQSSGSPTAEAQSVTGAGDQEKVEDKDPESKAISAAIDRDPEGVDAALKGFVDGADSEELRAERESLHLYFVVLAGRVPAVNQLRALADKHPAQSKIVERLAYALESIGENRQAADELRTRRKELADGQLTTAVLEARLRLALGEPESGLDLARYALEHTTDPNDRAAGLIQEGYALEALKRRIEAFASFEQALVLTPGNSELRFHLAYEYSQDGFDSVALSHYETLTSQGLKGSTANNLAVALRKFGMPILAVERFKRAGDDSAQAHGNLAHLLITDGFVDEALKHIKAGEAIEEMNQRVASAAVRIGAERETEAAKHSDISKVGTQLRDIFVHMDTRTPGETPAGVFTSQNGHNLVIEGVPDGLKGKLDDEWDVEAKSLSPYLEFSLSKGALVKTRASGRGICRDGVLFAYFQDWPSTGMTTPFIGSLTKPNSSEQSTLSLQETRDA